MLPIGDGMGLTQIYAAYTANRGQLNILNIVQGSSQPLSPYSYITDSAMPLLQQWQLDVKQNNRFVLVLMKNGKALVSIIQNYGEKISDCLILSGVTALTLPCRANNPIEVTMKPFCDF
jgi:alkaline phosphatase